MTRCNTRHPLWSSSRRHREIADTDDIYYVRAIKNSPRIPVIRNGGKRTRENTHSVPRFFSSPPVQTGKIIEFPRKSVIFVQGVPAKTVMYIQQGAVKLSVVNEVGKEAVVAMLGPGDFFGEGCLARTTDSSRHSFCDCAGHCARDRKRRNDSPPPRRAQILRSLYFLPACQKYPNRSGSGRSTF